MNLGTRYDMAYVLLEAWEPMDSQMLFCAIDVHFGKEVCHAETSIISTPHHSRPQISKVIDSNRNMGQSLSNLRRRRSASTLRNLAPRPTSSRAPVNFSHETLLNALENVALYLAAKNNHITLMVVGGAVNTLLLHSLPHTHDVDFFNDNLNTAEIEVLLKATKSAMKMDRALQDQWLNNHTVLFMSLNLRRLLTAQSLTQNEIGFQAQELTIFAAPWEYMICTKIDRISSAGVANAHPHDQDDVLYYLERYLLRRQGNQLLRSGIQSWFQEYSLAWNTRHDQVLAELNVSYMETFSLSYDVIDLTN